MSTSYLLQWVGASPFAVLGGTPYAIWTYRVDWTDAASAPVEKGPAGVRMALVLSRRIRLFDPSRYPNVPEIQATGIDTPASGDVQFIYRDFRGTPASPVVFAFIAPAAEDTFCPVRLVERPAPEVPWTPLQFGVGTDGEAALQQLITGPSFVCDAALPAGPGVVLEHATRSVPKATHVPLQVVDAFGLTARSKLSFARQLDLQPGEIDAATRAMLGANASVDSADEAARLGNALRGLRPISVGPSTRAVGAFTAVPDQSLQRFGRAIVQLREAAIAERLAAAAGGDVSEAERRRLQAATTANEWLEVTATLLPSPIGLLNLERIEMAPAGIERGELIATIPLAPGEKTAVVQKEWSVTSKEFTSIVTDSLENFSETGVTDNTELAQSTTSQIQHANQFNITGTVSGGIPLISGSSTSTFGMQDSSSQSATDSRKHTVALTQKASSRTKQEHKVTISTSTVTGTSESTTRELVNSSVDPIRIDYFSMMRKWRVRLYRYGLRLTYDIVIPSPGAAFRATYAELDALKQQVGPFRFVRDDGSPVTHAMITPGNYLALADEFEAQVPLPPVQRAPVMASGNPGGGDGWHFASLDFEVPADNEVVLVHLFADIGGIKGKGNVIVVVEQTEPLFRRDVRDAIIDADIPGFLAGAVGKNTVNFNFVDGGPLFAALSVSIRPTDEAMQRWRNDVWNALYNAAQTQYFSRQQDLITQIAQLEDKLNNVDTLTLRREESEQIMKGALRFLLGVTYEFMDDTVDLAMRTSGEADPPHGVAFTANKVAINALQLVAVSEHENDVRFINQAIEWENVGTFLYSYFWDMPESWDFIRQIRHVDATRQAFLRAGSARVVLTVRKGWEQAWVAFVDGIPPNQKTPRLTIAQEVAAYDDRNYPGILPANPGRAAVGLQDAVYTTSPTQIPPSGGSLPMATVVLDVESTDGFLVGATVLVDSGVHLDDSNTFGWQESATITAVGANQLTLDLLQFAHGGDAVAYAVVQPGEKGVLIAEWNEYTPSSGTDIAVTSNLATIA